MTTIVVADDQKLLRASLVALVSAEPDLVVVGEAATGEEALRVTDAVRPDIVLMDIRMPGSDGLEATRRICSEPSLQGVKVLILSMFDLDEYVYAALRAGASGFLLKDSSPTELLDAIRRTAEGEVLLSPVVVRRLIAHYLALPPTSSRHSSGLSARETEVLTMIGRGLSNAEIARALHISVTTVKTHVSHLLSKLGVRDRVHLAIAAYEMRLILPQE